MPIKDPEKRREYNRLYVRRRRAELTGTGAAVKSSGESAVGESVDYVNVINKAGFIYLKT
jgi:hypothetical protein